MKEHENNEIVLCPECYGWGYKEVTGFPKSSKKACDYCDGDRVMIKEIRYKKAVKWDKTK